MSPDLSRGRPERVLKVVGSYAHVGHVDERRSRQGEEVFVGVRMGRAKTVEGRSEL